MDFVAVESAFYPSLSVWFKAGAEDWPKRELGCEEENEDVEEGLVSTAAAPSRAVLDTRAARTAAASSRTPARITASEHRAYPSSSMDESSVRPR